MTKDQEALLELLVKVRDFMEDNGITFYLFGGSCIGAVRHHGFIPWDNDIDIIMDRDNYNRLIAKADQLPWDDVEFACFENNRDYFRPFGQFSSKKDTYFLKSRVFNKGTCMGTIIDVFVMDFVPEAKLEDHKKALLMYEEILGIYRLCRKDTADYLQEYDTLVEEERQSGRAQVVDRLKTEIEKYSEEESDYLVTRFWVIKYRSFRKEWFGKPEYMDFEGEKMPVPCNPQAVLRFQYGHDWYRVPQEREQKVKSFYVNHEISSNNYVDDLNNFIDNDAVEELLMNRKHYQISRTPSQMKMQKIKSQLFCRRLLLENGIDDNSDFRKLDVIIDNMKKFAESEMADQFISESKVAQWIDWLVYAGRFYDAVKVKTAFCPELETPRLDRVIELTVACQEGNLTDIEDRLRAIPEEERNTIGDCIVAEGRLIIGNDQGHEAACRHIEKCSMYLQAYPDNWDVMKIQGDLLIYDGRQEEAEPLMKLVYENSRNGMDLLDIEDRKLL